LIAASARTFKRPKDGEPIEWTPLTNKLLEKAPNNEQVFAEIVGRLRPMGWSGSLATKLAGRLKLLERLPLEGIPTLAAAAENAKAALRREIDNELKNESTEARKQNARFE